MSLKETNRIIIPLTAPPRSLCWDGDELVDWVGGNRFGLDGSNIPARVYFAYRFDRAIISPNRKYAIIYETLGTKGLIIQGNRLVREINRSYYHANAYEYPVDTFELPDGRTAVVHCPDEYNRIEIEEIESGERLTRRESKPADFFHSRFQITPDGNYLLSAGWIWHPLDFIQVFPLQEALKSPSILDESIPVEVPDELYEVNTATFLGNDSIVISGTSADRDQPPPYLAHYGLQDDGRLISVAPADAIPGTLMPIGTNHVIGFHQYPKLFEIASGKVVQSWPELPSGKQNSSIMHHQDPIPPLALDSKGMRFAVADAKAITVIQLG